MNEINKKDLIRFIGENLYRLYNQKVISIPPEYDTTFVDEDTDLMEVIDKFFLTPYKRLIEQKKNLNTKEEKYYFDSMYPNIEHEFAYVIRSIEGFVSEYVKIRTKAELQKNMEERMFINKELRENLMREILILGRQGGRKSGN